MEIKAITEIISNVGFPIGCVIVMGWFIFQIYQKTMEEQKLAREENKANMVAVQARCKEREDILYAEIAKNREVNAKAIQTIAQYAEKLDTIQTDINEIKTDITVIMTKAGG